MPAPLKIASAIICDDIRVENTGKYLLIGVYVSNVLVRDFPSRLPLTFWTEVEPAKTGEFSAEMRVINVDDSSVLMNGQINFKFAKVATSAIAVPRISVEFQKPGSFEFQWKLDGTADWLAVKRFIVDKRPATSSANAS